MAESALILSLISVLMHIYFIFMHKTTIDESKESEFKETPLPFVRSKPSVKKSSIRVNDDKKAWDIENN